MGGIRKEKEMTDLEALGKIRKILDEFYPEVRKAMLEYCLMVTEKDLEA